MKVCLRDVQAVPTGFRTDKYMSPSERNSNSPLDLCSSQPGTAVGDTNAFDISELRVPPLSTDSQDRHRNGEDLSRFETIFLVDDNETEKASCNLLKNSSISPPVKGFG